MKTLHISVSNKVSEYRERDGFIVCGNSNYQIEFAFDSEWDEHEEKTARFVWNNQYFDQEFTGNVCPCPIIKNATEVSVGVYAGNLETTTGANIPCRPSILCGEMTQHPDSGQNYSDEAKEAAGEARRSATEAASSASAASSSASAAKQSASNASSSSITASRSATAASSSATAASSSASAASSSATAASSSASAASSSASAANQSASEAKAAAEEAKAIAADLTGDSGRVAFVEVEVSKLDKRVTNLEKGISPDPFVTDDSVAYQKTVPANALPYAAIERVGGMSYKSINLFDKDNANVIGGYFTGAGNITSSVETKTVFVPCEPNTYYTVTKVSSARLVIGFCADIPAVGVAVTDTRVGGDNKAEATQKSPTNAAYLVIFCYHAAIDTLSFDDIISSIMINKGETALPYEPYFDGIRHAAVTAIESENANGETTLSRVLVPKEAQALDGYGWGISKEVNNYFSYDDNGRVTWHKKLGGVDLGSLSWEYRSTSDCFRGAFLPSSAVVGNSTAGKEICGRYTTIPSNTVSASSPDKSIAIGLNNYVYVVDRAFGSDTTAFKAAMSGVMLYYELSVPEETDITYLISPDNFILVEGGGTLTFVNEHSLAAPSTVLYLTKEETV